MTERQSVSPGGDRAQLLLDNTNDFTPRSCRERVAVFDQFFDRMVNNHNRQGRDGE